MILPMSLPSCCAWGRISLSDRSPSVMYNMPSGPKAMNFQVWPVFGFGRSARTVTGAGGAFCAGGDTKVMAQGPPTDRELRIAVLRFGERVAAVELAVELTADMGTGVSHALAAIFLALSMVFVYRSFYGMRIGSH